MSPESLENGIVQSVTEGRAGSELVAPAPAGATVLQLGDAVDFNEDGGLLILDDLTVVSYASADLDTDELHLHTPLAEAWPEETSVEVYPLVVERRVLVQLDLDGEAVDARVPHYLFDRLPLGTREDGERVSLSLDGSEWVVADLLGQEPFVDGSYIDPGTLPEVELPPIGPTEPPSSSPTLTAVGSASAITLVADGVVDPSTVLDYFMDGQLIESTRSTVVIVRSTPGGGDLDPDTSYSFYVVARNELGTAEPSPAVEASLNAEVDTETILTTVAAGFVLAGEIQLGNITLSPDRGITIPLASGGEIRFPADGSPAVIDAILRTADLTVRGGLSINGVTNYINGKLYLASGTSNPQSLLTIDWVARRELRRFPQVRAAGVGAAGLGRTADGSTWATVFTLPTGGEKEVVFIDNATGAVKARVHSDDALVDWRSVTAIGNVFYAMGLRWNSARGHSEFILHRYNSSGSQNGGWFLQDSGGNRMAPVSYWDGAIAADPSGTSLWLARTQSNGKIRWYRWALDGVGGALRDQNADETVVVSGAPAQLVVRAAYVGNGDFGSKRLIASGANDGPYGVNVFLPDGSWQESESWQVLGHPSALWWDASSSRFLAGDRDATSFYLAEFSPERTDRTVYAQYTWWDQNAENGNKESAPSPLNERVIPRRAFPSLGIPAPPIQGGGSDDPNAVRVYMDTDATTKLLTTVTSGRALTYISPTLAGTGAAPPPGSSFPTASATGEIASASGVDYFRGTGAFRFGGIQGAGDGRTVVPDGSKIRGFVPTGSITMYGGSSAPAGWLICDGSSVSRALYPELFEVLGTHFGTADASTFKLPDLRRRFPWGAEASGNPLGQSDAVPAEDRTPAHIHDSGSLSTGRPSTAPANTWNTPNTGGNSVPRTAQFDNHTHATEGSTAGSSFVTTGVANKSFPNLSVNFIIKT